MEEELFLDERFVTVAKMGTGRLFLKHSLLSPDLFGVSGCGPAISGVGRLLLHVLSTALPKIGHIYPISCAVCTFTDDHFFLVC